MSYDSKGTVNKVFLIGRLGQEPELKYAASGTAFVNLSLATNTSYKGQDGNTVENTEWHRVVAWRKQAEVIAQYSKKGSRLYVEGKLATRSWEDKNGVKQYTTEVIVDSIQFLDSAPKSESNDREPVNNEPGPPDGDDDLPF